MQYDAITVDTNIFDENGINLEGGMLQQLNQFGEGSAQFVLSEIVFREILRHLTDHGQKVKDALSSSIKRSLQHALLDAGSIEKANELYKDALEPKKAALNRLENFIADSGCEIIRADAANMKRLIQMYFGPSAPFEGAGSKKNEFPDAIALITLEDWARMNGKKVLGISKDGGWKRFAEHSDWIDVEPDLPIALQKFQQHAEQARVFVAEILQKIDAGDGVDLRSELESSVEDQISELSPYAEAASSYHFDTDLIEVAFSALSFLRKGDEFDFQIVQIGKDKIVTRVGIRVEANASAEFTFNLHDEGDTIPIGRSTVDEEIYFKAALLITLEGDFTTNLLDIEITNVELVDAIESVDFGDVSPDFLDEG